jgi:hypothetical protein
MKSCSSRKAEDYSEVLHHGKHHLSQDFGLSPDVTHAESGRWGDEAQSVQPMQAADQPGDIGGELLFNPFLCVALELMRCEKQSGEARVGVERSAVAMRAMPNSAGKFFPRP